MSFWMFVGLALINQAMGWYSGYNFAKHFYKKRDL